MIRIDQLKLALDQEEGDLLAAAAKALQVIQQFLAAE